MENNKSLRRGNSPMDLQPMTAQSEVGRWIIAQDHQHLSPEVTLADFGLLLRVGRN